MHNRPTVKNGSRYAGLPISVGLHACVVLVTLFSWSHKLDIKDENVPIVPVDLVTLADKTNVAPMTTAAPKDQDEPQSQPAPPQPKAEPAPPPPTPKAEPAPPQVKPQPAPPKAEPAPSVKPQPAPKAPPKPQPTPQPDKTQSTSQSQSQTKPKENFDINNIMALLDKRNKASGAAHRGKMGPQDVKGIGAQDAMTADLRSYLQSQIYKCWNPPAGSPNASKLIVQFRLQLNRDGSIGQPPQLLATGIATSDPFMRAAIEAARRALYVCAPYKLPADRYAQWKDVTFVFNPRDMMGQ